VLNLIPVQLWRLIYPQNHFLFYLFLIANSMHNSPQQMLVHRHTNFIQIQKLKIYYTFSIFLSISIFLFLLFLFSNKNAFSFHVITLFYPNSATILTKSGWPDHYFFFYQSLYFSFIFLLSSTFKKQTVISILQTIVSEVSI
jgi:hypothetical protein